MVALLSATSLEKAIGGGGGGALQGRERADCFGRKAIQQNDYFIIIIGPLFAAPLQNYLAHDANCIYTGTGPKQDRNRAEKRRIWFKYK